MAFLSFPYGWPWDAPPPSPESVRTYVRTLVRSYADVITKFSRLDGLPIFLTQAPLTEISQWVRVNFCSYRKNVFRQIRSGHIIFLFLFTVLAIEHERSVGENTRRSGVFFPTSWVLYCFLSALQQTEHSRGFFICFMVKNQIISPRILLNFQTNLCIPTEQKWRQPCTVLW